MSAVPSVMARAMVINPAINPWVLVCGAILAAIAIVYLYSAQRQIASPMVVIALMVIRLALALLVILMLLGPVRQWVHIEHSSGTLFVLVDQSASMRQKDPQATDREVLQWASALGYLPADLQLGHADVWAMQLRALGEDLAHVQSAIERQADNVAIPARLDRWRAKLNALAAEMARDPETQQLASDLPDTLSRDGETIGKSIVSVRYQTDRSQMVWAWTKIVGAIAAITAVSFLAFVKKRIVSALIRRAVPAIIVALVIIAAALGGWVVLQWPTDAQATGDPAVQSLAGNAEIPWSAIEQDICKAGVRIGAMAEDSDNRFLQTHASNPAVRQALDRVRQMDRAELALAVLGSKSCRGFAGLTDVMDRQEVKLVPFGEECSIITPASPDIGTTLGGILRDPTTQHTDITEALKLVEEQAGDDSTLVVISDGRQNVGSDPEAVAKKLGDRGLPVYTLAIGSPLAVRDAAVDHVDAPDWVFTDDEVAVSPVIRLDGLKDQDVTVELRRGDQVVDTKSLRAKTDQEKIQLSLKDKPPGEGNYDYAVAIQPVPGEAIASNNQQTIRVAVKKDRLNVLLVEDEPGWEYQFLRNYLARDHRVKLQVVLFDPAHIEQVQSPAPVQASASRREGQIDAQLLPATRDQWSAFDIVILGDIPPEKLSAEQQKNLIDPLRDGGIKALLLIAGQRNMPARYAASALADVIPVQLSASRWSSQQLLAEQHDGFTPALAMDGTHSILGQLSDDFETNSEIWANLPRWFWHSEQTEARPAASVIWSLQDANAATTGATTKSDEDSVDPFQIARQRALLATMNAGLGKVLYLASPQTWRLRYVQTPGDDSHIEDAHRRFWGQVIRWAVGSDLPAGGKGVRFGTDKHSYIGGEPIAITARVLRDNGTPLVGDAFKVSAVRPDGSAAGKAMMSEITSEGAGIYRGTMTLPAGDFSLTIEGGEAQKQLDGDLSIDASQKRLSIQVAPGTSVEDKDVNTDPQRMSAIARAGSGLSMPGSGFDVLADHLPTIDHVQTQVVSAGLFTDPDDPRTKRVHWAFFGLFLLLITAEWILRKRGGLV